MCLNSRILFQEAVDLFISNFSHSPSFVRVKVINSPSFPCVMAISVMSPSRPGFCTPLVSSTAGPLLKLSDPNVTNSVRMTTIVSSV